MKDIALTCLKPSEGGLHLGHYIGNIQPLINYQDKYDCVFMFADLQVLNSDNRGIVNNNILLMLKQMIALGVDPNKVRFLRESTLKKDKIMDFIFLSNYVTNARLNRLPVFKTDDKPKKMSKYLFPILQIMDFYLTGATVAFSNIDNKSIIELTNEVFKRINHECNLSLKHIELIHGKVEMLVGFDGIKMSKSKNNCIFFTDDHKEISQKVKKMYTDPNHVKATDCGSIADNVVFKYLKAFLSELEYEDIVNDYSNGLISDSSTKTVLSDVLNLLISNCMNMSKEIDDGIIEIVN